MPAGFRACGAAGDDAPHDAAAGERDASGAGGAASRRRCSPEIFCPRLSVRDFSWLRRRGRRLPAVLLPEAVRWAAAGGHEVIRPVLGRAGEQLCRDNPAWRPLLADGAGAAAEQTGGVDLSLWDEASPEVRCRLLQSLRARDPQAGRELAAPLLRRAFSKNRLLLYAGFEPSRDIWCLYIEALRRRTEDCLRWRVMRKVARLDPAWREVFSALWNPELDECTPESFQRWTCRRFRDSHGMTPVLYHVAWEMPLDLLEKFIQTLQLPPAVTKKDFIGFAVLSTTFSP